MLVLEDHLLEDTDYSRPSQISEDLDHNIIDRMDLIWTNPFVVYSFLINLN